MNNFKRLNIVGLLMFLTSCGNGVSQQDLDRITERLSRERFKTTECLYMTSKKSKATYEQLYGCLQYIGTKIFKEEMKNREKYE